MQSKFKMAVKPVLKCSPTASTSSAHQVSGFFPNPRSCRYLSYRAIMSHHKDPWAKASSLFSPSGLHEDLALHAMKLMSHFYFRVPGDLFLPI